MDEFILWLKTIYWAAKIVAVIVGLVNALRKPRK